MKPESKLKLYQAISTEEENRLIEFLDSYLVSRYYLTKICKHLKMDYGNLRIKIEKFIGTGIIKRNVAKGRFYLEVVE